MKPEKDPALNVRCPTCGAKPREKCELSTGQPRTDPHSARCLAAEGDWLDPWAGLIAASILVHVRTQYCAQGLTFREPARQSSVIRRTVLWEKWSFKTII